jgi:hypothetical protein
MSSGIARTARTSLFSRIRMSSTANTLAGSAMATMSVPSGSRCTGTAEYRRALRSSMSCATSGSIPSPSV